MPLFSPEPHAATPETPARLVATAGRHKLLPARAALGAGRPLGAQGYAWRRIAGYEGKSRGPIRLLEDREDGNFFCFPEERLADLLPRMPPG